VVCWDKSIKITISINKEYENIKIIQEDYCVTCKSTKNKFVKNKYDNVCENCKCGTENCINGTIYGFDFCFDCKCNSYYCNHKKQNNPYGTCDNCTCPRCSSDKLPDEEICESCEIYRVNKSIKLSHWRKCTYQLCNKYTLEELCKEHSCSIYGCKNIIDDALLCVDKHSPKKGVCGEHKVWKIEYHSWYPAIFNMSVKMLLLILKRNEGKIKIPKFVKYEMIKRTLCLWYITLKSWKL